jgi:hypothetical protein
MAKAKGRGSKARKSPSAKKSGAGRRAAAKSGAGPNRKRAKNTGRRTSGARTPKGKARKRASASKRGGAATKASTSTGRTARTSSKRAPARKASSSRPRREGGTGRERDLAQTPETGRSVVGPTNPMRTIRSTDTPAGAGDSRHVPRLERERRQLREIEESIPEPPSSLNMDRKASAARTGRAEMRQARREHTETSPALTGGDVDADWEDAYAVGDEAPGGDNPTPDQDIVDDIGRALGVEYQDNEELKSTDKITERDKHRWELDPASSDDYKDRD